VDVKYIFCDSTVGLFCVATWGPAGMLVQYVTSHFMESKNVRCGACEIRFHCVCLQLGEAEQSTLSATGESQ
jgi:hypothetical protein